MPVSVQDIMRAGVYPCKALVHECNAGNSMSSEACVGAMIACNYAETVPYQMSGYNPYDMRIKCEKFPLCYDFSNVETFLNRYYEERKVFLTSPKDYRCDKGMRPSHFLHISILN